MHSLLWVGLGMGIAAIIFVAIVIYFFITHPIIK